MTATREVHIERVLSAPPERVWQAISNPAELPRWLAPAELTPGVGGHIRLLFEHDRHIREGEILVWDEPRTLEYQWLFSGEQPSILRFELAPHPQGTRLTLRHRLLPAHLADGYASGWQAHLDCLEGHLNGHIPDFWERYRHWQDRHWQ